MKLVDFYVETSPKLQRLQIKQKYTGNSYMSLWRSLILSTGHVVVCQIIVVIIKFLLDYNARMIIMGNWLYENNSRIMEHLLA